MKVTTLSLSSAEDKNELSYATIRLRDVHNDIFTFTFVCYNNKEALIQKQYRKMRPDPTGVIGLILSGDLVSLVCVYTHVCK